jgi:hypothetical protein
VSVLLVIKVFVYLLTTGCSVRLFPRLRHWRLKFLDVVIGLAPLYQVVVLLTERNAWPFSASRQVGEYAELLVSSLFLVAIFILDLDGAERRRTEVHLRLIEATASVPALHPLGRSRRNAGREDRHHDVGRAL